MRFSKLDHTYIAKRFGFSWAHFGGNHSVGVVEFEKRLRNQRPAAGGGGGGAPGQHPRGRSRNVGRSSKTMAKTKAAASSAGGLTIAEAAFTDAFNQCRALLAGFAHRNSRDELRVVRDALRLVAERDDAQVEPRGGHEQRRDEL